MSPVTKQLKIDLPDHAEELQQSEEYIKNLKNKLELVKRTRRMSNRDYTLMYERITRGLYYVGSLSKPAFEVEDKVEDFYFSTYKSFPELARKLWIEHYDKIHHPYNILKNRLFRLFEELDSMYKKFNKSNPPAVLEDLK